MKILRRLLLLLLLFNALHALEYGPEPVYYVIAEVDVIHVDSNGKQLSFSYDIQFWTIEDWIALRGGSYFALFKDFLMYLTRGHALYERIICDDVA